MVEGTHVTDYLAEFALGSLDAIEDRMVSEHLAACPHCRAELLSYSDVLGQLGRSVPEVEPPAALKQAVMQRIQPPAAKTGVEPETSWWRRLQAGWLGSPALAAASLVVILVLGMSNLLLWQQVRVLNSTTPANQDHLQTVVLQGSELVPGATGMLVISQDGEHGTLVVDRLPALDEGHQYQLWLISEDESRTSGGVFSVSPDGYGSVWVDSPQALVSYPRFGVTIEPAGGSQQPTGERVLGGSL